MASKQRIMMISTHGYVAAEPELGKPDTGGQVVYVLELSKCLARLGYQVDILTRQFEGQPKEERIAERCRLLRFPCGADGFIPKERLWEELPEWVGNVWRYIRSKRVKYSGIISHYWDAGVAAQSLANSLRVRHLFTPHTLGSLKRDALDGDPDELDRKYNFKRRIREERNILQACDGVIATTAEQRQAIVASEYDTDPSKIYVIPPGYDDTLFFPVSRATQQALKQEYGDERPLVLAAGRLVQNKGYDLLIQALPTIVQRIPEVGLHLAIGSAEPSAQEQSEMQQLQELARELGVYDRVHFGSCVDQSELPDLYRLADVFALCSRHEPFGMTAVEAMACGTPTVITTEGGLWEQVVWGLEALYANPLDPESYGHAICFILQHPRVAGQLAHYGSQKARAKFTWMGIAHQILHVLQGYRVAQHLQHREDFVDTQGGFDTPVLSAGV